MFDTKIVQKESLLGKGLHSTHWYSVITFQNFFSACAPDLISWWLMQNHVADLLRIIWNNTVLEWFSIDDNKIMFLHIKRFEPPEFSIF